MTKFGYFAGKPSPWFVGFSMDKLGEKCSTLKNFVTFCDWTVLLLFTMSNQIFWKHCDVWGSFWIDEEGGESWMGSPGNWRCSGNSHIWSASHLTNASRSKFLWGIFRGYGKLEKVVLDPWRHPRSFATGCSQKAESWSSRFVLYFQRHQHSTMLDGVMNYNDNAKESNHAKGMVFFAGEEGKFWFRALRGRAPLVRSNYPLLLLLSSDPIYPSCCTWNVSYFVVLFCTFELDKLSWIFSKTVHNISCLAALPLHVCDKLMLFMLRQFHRAPIKP